MNLRAWKITPLLFGSGLCALVYQTAWLRELRLVFGASTAASAAVLAIFMGGLGLGSILLGKRADRHPRPLELYAKLELLIALATAVTPGLLWLARLAYVAVGGSVFLGIGGATVARLILSSLVLALPTLLMGGTLPAAAKAVEDEGDRRRTGVALLYGANTLGAVVGVAASTFFLLEIFGTGTTLWLACLLNAAIAVSARVMARSLPSTQPAPSPQPDGQLSAQPPAALPPTRFVLLGAGVVGFAFLLMELIWYRMLGPILGGSTFTFGLILAIALLGIGIGGGAYALWGRQRSPTLQGFALTCALEALLVALPYALGDRLAVFALLLRPLGSVGFHGLLLSWAAVASVVVLPAALVAGYQFPMLIGLLGRGGEDVGRQVGLAYAWNTGGSIVGSLAGGFGLLPLLGAPGTWKLVVGVLVCLALAGAVLSAREDHRLWRLAAPITAALCAVMLLFALGPTAAWRHSPIGAGRAGVKESTVNALRSWRNSRLRAVFWEAEGVESSVALSDSDGVSFLVNGKSDGHAILDGATQVMAGLVGAILHPKPTRSFVVGLGTGSTAGWLAAIPSMERVDVVEIEPSILEVAKQCAAVNQNVLANTKVKTQFGDAREVLLTTSQRYDVIFSEPSNPYRAGIASLYTREFYQAIRSRLEAKGVFVQWLQAYEIDAATVRTVIATLASEFPSIQVWQGHPSDLLLVASLEPLHLDAGALRTRIAEEPYRSALDATWAAIDLEGFLARFIASERLAPAIASLEGDALNTDDHPLIEFSFSRSVGRTALFKLSELIQVAQRMGADRPDISGAVDWERVDEERLNAFHFGGVAPPQARTGQARTKQHHEVFSKFRASDPEGAFRAWEVNPFQASGPFETAVIAELAVERGDPRAAALVEQLSKLRPIEAAALAARLRFAAGDYPGAAQSLEAAFTGSRSNPWVFAPLLRRTLNQLPAMAKRDRALGQRAYASLAEPFSLNAHKESRQLARLALSEALDPKALCAEAFAPLEPNVPWDRKTLTYRRDCYRLVQSPLAVQAERELAEFNSADSPPFVPGLDEAPASQPRDEEQATSRN